MILEAEGTVRYVSPAVERVLGYQPEDLVGTLAFDQVHPGDIEHVSKSLAEALEKPGVQPPVEYRVRAADGSWRHMEAIRCNWLGDPHILGVVAMLGTSPSARRPRRRCAEARNASGPWCRTPRMA
jgi:PAS domain S-box-containing protein